MITPHSKTVKIQKTIKIICESYNKPNWLLNGNYLEMGQVTKKKNKYTLTKQILSEDDYGIYSCTGWTKNKKPFYSESKVSAPTRKKSKH